MRRVAFVVRALFAVATASGLAACESAIAAKGNFAATIQQFSLPDNFSRLFNGKTGKSQQSVLHGTARAAQPRAIALKEDADALPAEEIRRLLTANSLYAGGGGIEFAAVHASDGTLTGRAWSAEGTTAGQGEWRVDGEGIYCRKWSNEWANGQWGCFKLAEHDGKLRLRRVTGAGADGEMMLVPGNAYGL